MVALALILTISATAAEPSFDARLRLAAWGPGSSRGVLVNRTAGAAPGGRIDPSRPTVVVVHGLNPFRPMVQLALTERYAEALAARHGSAVNVLGWDWNADTMPSVRPRANQAHAVQHGRQLAAALEAAGIAPERLHLIGQSSGSLVIASTARVLADRGRPPARLTLLDPAFLYHDLLFEALQVGTAAPVVENVWTTGLSGYGREAPYPNIRNTRLTGTRGLLGLVRPMHSDHLDVVRWHAWQLGR